MKNVLIIKPSSFGDIVQALPVAAAAKAEWPDAAVSWLVNDQYRLLLDRNPCIDRLIIFERNLWRKRRDIAAAAASFGGLCRDLRRARFDAVLDLQGLFRSGLFAAMTGAPVRAGFADAREGASRFYTLKVAAPAGELHAVERYLLAARAVGCGAGQPPVFPLGVGAEDDSWAERTLAAEGGGRSAAAVGLSPSARWVTKRWPPEYFARLGDELLSSGLAVVVIGGPAGEGRSVAELMRGSAVVADRIEDPLRMAALISRLSVLVTNDSGPMHLAAAVGTPVVALFGPTSRRRTGPWGPRHRVIAAPVGCRPCYRRECDREEQCMRAISVEAVAEAVRQLLAAEHTEGTEKIDGKTQ